MDELVPSPKAAEALSLLFTDIERSSTLWDRDPPAMRIALQLHDQVVREVAARHGGQVFFNGGDGFGIAFESPRAAVAAARDAQLALAASAWPQTTPLAVRMGVHTGQVEQRDGNVFGSTVNRAARVTEAGHGGQVLLSGVTAALVHPEFELVDQGSFELRGLQEPERLWWLPVPRAHAGPFPTPRTVRTGQSAQPPLPTRMRFDNDVSFVGRGHHVEHVVLAAHEARTGGSPVILIDGEPGVGKSRLVAEVGARLHADGATVLYGRCDPHGASPFQPFAEALSALAQSLDRPATRAVFAPGGGELANLIPRLGQLLPGITEPFGSDSGDHRHRMFNAIGDTLAALTGLTTEVVLVIDDVHWGDVSTLALLEHLATAVAPPHVAVIVTYRSTDVARDTPAEQALSALRRRNGATVIDLDGLTLDEVRSYLIEVDGDLVDLDDIVADLHARTEGNPFFLRELIRHLQDNPPDQLRGPGRGAVLHRVGAPQGVRELVRERLRSLPPDAVDVLSAASILGQEFDVRAAARCVAVDAPTALVRLEPAVSSGLVNELGRGRFAFVHLLVRTSIYDDLPAARRIAGHLAAASALEALGGEERHWSELAYHWGQVAVAGYVAEAVSSALCAAERSIAVAAHDAAVEYLRLAISHLGDAPEPHPVDRIEVQLRLAEALNLAGHLDEAEPVFLESADLARQAGQTDAFGRAALGLGGDLPSTPPVNLRAITLVERALELHDRPSPTRALLLCRLAERRHRAESAAGRQALVDEALDVARTTGDDALLARVMLSRVRALHGPGAIEEMIETSTEVDRIAGLVCDDALAVRAAQVRMNACFVLGDLSGAVQAAGIASMLAARLRQPEFQRIPLMWEAFRAMYEGRFDAGRAICAELRALLTVGCHSQTAELVGALLSPQFVFQGKSEAAYQISKDFDFSYRDALLASYSAESGALDRARHHLDRLGSVAHIDSDANWSWWQGMTAAANAAAICGDLPLLTEVRGAIAPWSHQHATAGLVTYLGSGHHHLGVVEAALGNLDAGVDELRQAVAAHESIGARPYVALSQVELARALERRGRPGDTASAATLRSSALAAADQLGLATVAARA